MRKTISFINNYEEEFKYLCSQANASVYVCKLIRQDRLKQKGDIEDKIFKMLQQIINSKHINAESTSVNPETKKKAAGRLLNIGK